MRRACQISCEAIWKVEADIAAAKPGKENSEDNGSNGSNDTKEGSTVGTLALELSSQHVQQLANMHKGYDKIRNCFEGADDKKVSDFRYVLALTRRRRGRPNQQGGVGHLLPSVCGGEGSTSEEVEYLGAGELNTSEVPRITFALGVEHFEVVFVSFRFVVVSPSVKPWSCCKDILPLTNLSRTRRSPILSASITPHRIWDEEPETPSPAKRSRKSTSRRDSLPSPSQWHVELEVQTLMVRCAQRGHAPSDRERSRP
mmetsp:Transcript_29854/g.79757  ORF Transcript_29854/g.79757 Transcript_29854/m.79757 type:complete len:257 (+) Transcript_29854:1217-1987(+)